MNRVEGLGSREGLGLGVLGQQEVIKKKQPKQQLTSICLRVYVALRTLLRPIVPLKQIEYGVYGDLIVIYSKPYSIYLRGL